MDFREFLRRLNQEDLQMHVDRAKKINQNLKDFKDNWVMGEWSKAAQRARERYGND